MFGESVGDGLGFKSCIYLCAMGIEARPGWERSKAICRWVLLGQFERIVVDGLAFKMDILFVMKTATAICFACFEV